MINNLQRPTKINKRIGVVAECVDMGTGTVRIATAADVDGLPAMQVEAGAIFRDFGMDLVADGPRPSVGVFRTACETGNLLVATIGDDVVGFVLVEPLDEALHVNQLTVAPAAQRRGIGGALMRAVERTALESGYQRMTLTTYRDLPFNGLFYRRLGWAELGSADQTRGLRALRDEEAAVGLDRWPRVAMVKQLLRDEKRDLD